jgi:hypothetical protein
LAGEGCKHYSVSLHLLVDTTATYLFIPHPHL